VSSAAMEGGGGLRDGRDMTTGGNGGGSRCVTVTATRYEVPNHYTLAGRSSPCWIEAAARLIRAE